MLKVHIITPAQLQTQHGIGQYTQVLASRLCKTMSVTLLLPKGSDASLTEGVASVSMFDIHSVWGSAERVVEWTVREKPNWLVLQYDAGSFHWRELALWVPVAMRQVRRRCPDVQMMAMIHEVPVRPRKLKSYVRAVWAYWSFWMIGRNADVVAFSIESWAEKYSSWFSRQKVLHLPVGSNLHRVESSTMQTRSELGINTSAYVIGMFGRIVNSLNPEMIRSAVAQSCAWARERSKELVLVYIGGFLETLRSMVAEFPDLRLVSEGELPPGETSRWLSCVDVFIAPYQDGASTRRTSMMCALQHGLAIAATFGRNTDRVFIEENGSAVSLVDLDRPDSVSAFGQSVTALLKDPAGRAKMGSKGAQLYEQEFSWTRLSVRWANILQPGALGSAV